MLVTNYTTKPVGKMTALLALFFLFLCPTVLNAQRPQRITSPDSARYSLRLHREDGGPSRVDESAGTISITRQRYDRILTIEQRRRRKGYWQFSGSMSVGFPYVDYYNRREYFRTEDASRSTSFILPSGEIIYGNNPEYLYDNDDFMSGFHAFPRFAAARQSKWGGYFHSTFGYYRSRVTPKGDPYSNISADRIRVARVTKEDVVTFELGFQYTFFRYRRVRPYVGMSLINYLYYYGESVDRFYDEASRSSGVIGGFRSKEIFPMYTELAFTAGAQVEVSNRVSVGAFLFFNEAWNIFLEAPVGLEVRYSLK
ncbi:hypothetical protein [Lewinella sp. 4G2]|uniref:hypothetical protein n=1 Tax=Lewinella sp. 4G2 TaxID=1803372 RepID=UPI0007B4F1F1|nr:hypothetical protein [Lewinella sp. 4G2]OAV42629.1 hypothetical protein A3850_015395 [Lewinella sp. 4G2]